MKLSDLDGLGLDLMRSLEEGGLNINIATDVWNLLCVLPLDAERPYLDLSWGYNQVGIYWYKSEEVSVLLTRFYDEILGEKIWTISHDTVRGLGRLESLTGFGPEMTSRLSQQLRLQRPWQITRGGRLP